MKAWLGILILAATFVVGTTGCVTSNEKSPPAADLFASSGGVS